MIEFIEKYIEKLNNASLMYSLQIAMKEEFRVFMREMNEYLGNTTKSVNEDRSEHTESPDWEIYDDDSVDGDSGGVGDGEGTADLIDLKGT